MLRNRTALVAPLVIFGLAFGCSPAKTFIEPPGLDGGDETAPTDTDITFDIGGDGTDPDSLTLEGLDIEPMNSTIYVDTATTPPTPASLTFKLTLHASDGSTKDVSAGGTFTVDDPVGTFIGPSFTSVTTLPGGALGVTTLVHANAEGRSAVTNMTVVALRKTGEKRDFYFTVPYAMPPTPSRDVLKFGTNIKQVDVAFVTDTTGSMGGSITNIQAGLSKTIMPGLTAAIPSVGLAIVGHRDFPFTPYGSTGDYGVKVFQVVTTVLADAQAATTKYVAGGGYDGQESQIPAMWHTLTGGQIVGPGETIAKHTPKPGTTGGVDIRPGSLPVIVEITDVDWHGVGHVPYTGYTVPDMPELKKAFADSNAKFVDVTNGAYSAPEDQANDLSDATKSNLPPAAFGGTCTTGMSGAARPATGPGGTCRLNFLHNSGAGVSDSIVKAIQAISVGSTFDVTAKPSNDPTNPDGVDATQFIKALRAMDEGDAANGCPAHAAKDTDADGVKDTFTTVIVGTPVCFEVLPKQNDTVKPKTTAQFFKAFIDVLGMPGSIKLDNRIVLFLVPPKDLVAK